MSKNLNKIGLLGGTFDPVHKGHIHIANQVMQAAQLDEVWLIPSGNPPHRKPPLFSARDRLKMCELAANENPRINVCDIESNKTTPCYTIDTVKALQAQYPHTEFFWIIGIDAFFKIESWHNWDELLSIIHFLVVNRDSFDGPKELDNKSASLVAIPDCPISGTKIRSDFARYWDDLPLSVRDYITKHNLL